MFERRLKIVLLLLILAAAGLGLRAAQLQIFQHSYWANRAIDSMHHVEFAQTTRGDILDRNGKRLVFDQPGMDACVDYRAIPDEPDLAWLQTRAEQNLRDRLGDDFSRIRRGPDWKADLDQEVLRLKSDIAAMWVQLAQASGQSPDQIDDTRRDIVARVEMRRRYVWWKNVRHAAAHPGDSAWYKMFLDSTQDAVSDAEKHAGDVAEATEPHVILHDINPQTQADLARMQDRFFALSLIPSKHRYYPYAQAACQILGRLTQVSPSDLGPGDPYADDDLRRYQPNDRIGRGGVEALCETTLRGVRGRVERDDSDQTVSCVDPVPGKNVRLTIDIDLQNDIQAAFEKQRSYDGEIRAHQHGAAVVIDVKTGQVLALVSNPGFDPNTLDADYAKLASDDLNLPLWDRATQMAVEPGSSVKPIVGAGSITDGVMKDTDTIQCKGVLVIDGHPQPFGHCWIYAACIKHNVPISHNATAPGLVDDQLTIADGLERSCNVVFETVADRMGMFNLMKWYDRFGLGRVTGIGIDETPGRLFRATRDDRNVAVRPLTWSAGIGEGVVHATPIQMANVAATIARSGIWLRPQIVSPDDISRAATRPDPDLGPDRVDLHLSPAAIAAVRKGMFNVVNGPAGTGTGILPQRQNPPLDDDPLLNIRIAGKTGTAQTSQLSIPRRDESGKIVCDAAGKTIYDPVPLGTPGTELWYKSVDNHFQHAWFIGYAPADHPQVAFCVMVEYGEAGGIVAGSIAHDVLVDCVKHGYLTSPHQEP